MFWKGLLFSACLLVAGSNVMGDAHQSEVAEEGNLEENVIHFEGRTDDLVKIEEDLSDIITGLDKQIEYLHETNSLEKTDDLNKTMDLQKEPVDRDFKKVHVRNITVTEQNNTAGEKNVTKVNLQKTKVKKKAGNLTETDNKQKTNDLQNKTVEAEKLTGDLQYKAGSLRNVTAHLQSKKEDLQKKAAELQSLTVDLQKITVDLQNKTEDLQNKAVNLQNITKDLKNKTIDLQNKTGALQSITTDLQTVHLENKTIGLQNKTGELHEKTVHLQNITVDLQNKTGELQNTTANLQASTIDLQNKTGELQNKAVTPQNGTVDVQNKTFDLQNRTENPWEKFGHPVKLRTGGRDLKYTWSEFSEVTKSIPWTDFLRHGMSYNTWNPRLQGWHPSWYPCREWSFNNTCTYYDPRENRFAAIELAEVIDMVLSNWTLTHYPLVKNSWDICCGGEPFYLTRGKYAIWEMKYLGFKPVDSDTRPERQFWDSRGKVERYYNRTTRYSLPFFRNFRRYFFNENYANDMKIKPEYYDYAKSLIEWSKKENKEARQIPWRGT